MSLDFPTDFNIDLDLSPIDLTADINGIPTNYTFNANVAPLDVNLGPVEIRPLEIRPLDISMRLKEIPSIRAHFPLDYRVGLSVLGAELLCVRLCGQGQLITEPYVPYPCEPRANAQVQPSLATLERIVNGKENGKDNGKGSGNG